MISDAEAFLLDFHAQSPGGSARVFARGRDVQGRSSYERLVQGLALTRDDPAMVDVACGDGYLLELLRKKWPRARLIGIDMSRQELHAARERLGPGIEVRCERAQAMTLESGSVDCVLSHMALMLMAPVDEVIGEIHRILRPNGVFAAVVGSDSRPPGAWAEFVAIARELGGTPTLALGDGRVRTVDGIRALFSPAAWSEIGIEDFELNIDGAWPQVEAYLFGTYVPELMEPDLREPLRRSVAARVPALAGTDGVIPCRIGMRVLRFRRLPETDHPR